ncbi:uncharacterized protein [Aegilops tauschii subsp. strangulata]|uniref:uncharacterized protein isoform X2 n=1 Tax=Aegilops tauschii subsp. strangulata TaxID=200361 RepID=UPI003CC8DDE0
MSRSCESGGGQTGDGDLGSKSMGKEAIGAGLWSGSGLDKDADGFHPLNVGNLALRSWKPVFVSCATIWIYLMESTSVICPSQEDNAEVVQVTSMFRDEAKIKDAHS